MELEGLGDLVLETILSKLDSNDVAIFACVSCRCKSYASDDNLWRKFCSKDIDLLVPQDPDGNPCPSFKVAYHVWRESFGMYPWVLVRRARKCWAEIKNWAIENFPEAVDTLQKGASEEDIKDLEATLGVKLPLATKVLYRFCNGQSTLENDIFKNRHLALLGIIGGYSFYEHVVNVHLLPLSLVIEETKNCASVLESTKSEYIVVASSCYVEKVFLLNCTNGQLYVGTRNLANNGEMLPCVPHDLIRLGLAIDLQQDAMLLWLEEHARCLQSGKTQVRMFFKSRYINLFPELPLLCSTAITSGVQVRASALLIPELCDLNSDRDKFWFSYSIRMRLLPERCILDSLHFISCQLLSRHWIIRANDKIVSNIRGEAVIGKFPLLSTTDKGEFVYESCTPLPSSSGSVEGSFTFVPGRLTDPEGRQFEVKVGPFALEVPSYIF